MFHKRRWNHSSRAWDCANARDGRGGGCGNGQAAGGKAGLPRTFNVGCWDSARKPGRGAPVSAVKDADDGEKPSVYVSRKEKNIRKGERERGGREGGREKEKRKEKRKEKERRKERERKVKRGKKVLFIEASCSGAGASSPPPCNVSPATPLPPLAQVQLNVNFNASESIRLILSMINCQRHGWPYGTEKASSNSYFCM